MRMDEKIEKAVNYMTKVLISEGREWISPTEIGSDIGGHGKHNSYGSIICKEAVKIGFMERDKRGHYRVVVVNL